jgi:hypothetical protein
VQPQAAKDEVTRQRKILAASYGQHVPLRMQIESEILSKFRRLPSLQSSMLGLETLAGRDTQIDVADIFGVTSQPPHLCASPHFLRQPCYLSCALCNDPQICLKHLTRPQLTCTP